MIINFLIIIQEINELFDDCIVIRKNEVTIEEYTREIGTNRFNASNTKLTEKIAFDDETSLFDQCKYKEHVFDFPKVNKTMCRQRAKALFGSKGLIEEIDRIYSRENRRAFCGHPVHYKINASDWETAEKIYSLLLNALATNKRLISNRVCVLRDITRDAHTDEKFEQIIKAAEDGVIVVELKTVDDGGDFASKYHVLARKIGSLMQQLKKNTLFVFVEIDGEAAISEEDLDTIFGRANVVKISAGRSTYNVAAKYLMELAQKSDFDDAVRSNVVQFLPKTKEDSLAQIQVAYNEWHESSLKEHVYKAYNCEHDLQTASLQLEKSAYDELQDMVGLTDVKGVIDQIISFSKVLRLREKMGLNTDSSSLHMLFSGNPGTAKTSVARLLAKILRDENVLKSGKFVECGRQDLVGKYVGWTARIVEEKFKEALGGVLFIDEAYSLADGKNSFGAEAINTITQMMENYRNDVIVIFAGYPDKMQDFLAQNEGLRSRIAFHLNFPDYSSSELLEMIKLMAQNKQYSSEDDAIKICEDIFATAQREENFGNGRYARNVLEQAIMRQSRRIMSGCKGKEPLEETICCLTKDDFCMPTAHKKSKQKKIGFN